MSYRLQLLRSVCAWGCALAISAVSYGRTIYVWAGRPALPVGVSQAGDGIEWSSAFTNLSTALAAAAQTSSATNPTYIWIAGGTYTPDVNASDPRASTFSIPGYVNLIGGFDPTNPEATPEQRNSATPLPVLSGDISYTGSHAEAFVAPNTPAQANVFRPQDPTLLGFADNARHVVSIVNATGVSIDSVAISGGYAYGGEDDVALGQMLYADIGFTDPAAGFDMKVIGGGILVQESAQGTQLPDLTLSNCIVAGNYAQGFGGGVGAINAVVSVFSTVFAGNESRMDGGGYWGRGQNGEFVQSNFVNNFAADAGGGVALQSPATAPPGWSSNPVASFLTTNEGVLQGTISGIGKLYTLVRTVQSVRAIGFAQTIKNALPFMGETQSSAQLATEEAGDGASGAADTVTGAYGAICAIEGIVTIGADIASACGDHDTFVTFWTKTADPIFQQDCTPLGWITLLFQSLNPTQQQIRYAYTAAANTAPASIFSSCQFTNNSANSDGGAIYANFDNFIAEASLFTGNSSTSEGGAISVNTFNWAQLYSCGFTGNSGHGASALAVAADASLRVINCTIVNNQSSTILGAAITANMGGYARVYNSILWGNTGTNGNGDSIANADFFAAKPSNMTADTLAQYNLNTVSQFTFCGTIDVANCDLQSPDMSDWNNNDDLIFVGNGQFTTPDQLKAFIALVPYVDATGTEDFYQFQGLGQGVRTRYSLHSDPDLNANLSPQYGSPVLGQGSNLRESNQAIAPLFDFDLLAQPRGGIYFDQPDVQPTPISIGAVQAPQIGDTATPGNNGRTYITVTGAGAKTGADWADAYPASQLATVLAQTNQEVWVGPGTYTAPAGGFVVGGGTLAYGGFSGTETAATQRAYGVTPTILSGNLGSGQSSPHVVAITSGAATLMDGFTITGGSAGGGFQTDGGEGGGVFVKGTPVVLSHLLIQLNSAYGAGGGIYVGNSGAVPASISDCQFVNNTVTAPTTQVITNFLAPGVGGGLFAQGPITVDRCDFEANSANQGAAIGLLAVETSDTAEVLNSLIHNNSTPNMVVWIGTNFATFQNCTIVGNQAATGFYCVPGVEGSDQLTDRKVTLLNDVLYGNTAPGTSTDLLEKNLIDYLTLGDRGVLSVTYCYIEGLSAFTSSPGNIDPGNPGFTSATNFEPLANSPLVDAGSGTPDASHDLDLADLPRVAGNAVDIGAYEYPGAGTEVPGSIRISRSFNGTTPVYTLAFIPSVALGSSVTYTWNVNQNDGNGFQPLPSPGGATSFSGAGSATLQVTAPPPSWDGYVFRVSASALVNSHAEAALTGIARSRLYVNPAATGTGDGSSWTNAFPSLVTAMTNAPDYAEIWVVQGSYFPSPTADTGVSFPLRPGLVVLGGFAGTETQASDRSTDRTTTVLNGAYNQFRGGALMAGNIVTYTLPAGADSSLPCALDGFVIENSAADAVYCNGLGNAFINNCTITAPSAQGLAITQTAVTVTNSSIQHCLDGGIIVDGGAITLQHSLITDNTGAEGAALDAFNFSTVVMSYCTVADNTAVYDTGGVRADPGSPLSVDHSIFWGNRDSNGTDPSVLEMAQLWAFGGPQLTTPKASVQQSIIEGLSVYAGNLNTGYDPLFTSAQLGDYTLTANSPAVSVAGYSLGAKAYPISSPVGPTLDFTSLPQSSVQHVNLTTEQFTATYNSSVNSITWQIDRGQGWVAAQFAGLGATVTTSTSGGLTTSVLTLTAANGGALPSFNVQAVTDQNVTLPPASITFIPPTVLRVDGGATGATQDGLSWATAFHSISAALDASAGNSASNYISSGYEIWVKQGTYVEGGTLQYATTPGTQSQTSFRDGTIQLLENVVLYGGFAGGEVSRTQRSTSPALTTVKGTFHSGNPSGGGDLGTQMTLDGFTVIAPSATTFGLSTSAQGNGSYNNCVFTNPNGTAVELNNSEVLFTNCTFSNSTASAASIQLSKARFVQCTFANNQNSDGGAINAQASTVSLIGCTLANNSSGSTGGAIAFTGASGNVLTVATTVLSGNHSRMGSAIYVNGASLVARNDTIADNHADLLSAVWVTAGTADVANSILWNNQGSTSPDLLSSWGVPLTGNGLIEQQQIHGDVANSVEVQYSLIQGLSSGYSGYPGNAPFAPLFAGAGDYTLTVHSPAISQGSLQLLNAVTPTAQDPNRIQGQVDAGAFEYAGTQSQAQRVALAAVPTSATVYAGGTVTFTVVTSNGSSATWLEPGNSSPVAGTSVGGVSTLTLTGVQAAAAGNYQFVIGDLNYTSPVFTLSVKNRTKVYVNGQAAAGGDGTSWTQAYRTVDAALASGQAGLEVMVASGTYAPVNGWLLQPGVVIEGGYVPTGATTATRDPVANPTYVTDTSFTAVPATLAQYPVTVDGVVGTIDANTGFDGLIFHATKSSAPLVYLQGAAAPQFTNCVIENAPLQAQPVATDGYSGGLFTSCTFRNNAGVPVSMHGGSVQANGCTFTGNANSLFAGTGALTLGTSRLTQNTVPSTVASNLIFLQGVPRSDAVTLSRTVMSGNASVGSLIYCDGPVTLANSLITANPTSVATAAGGTLLVTQSTIADNADTGGHSGSCLEASGADSSLTITDSILWNNQETGAASVAGAQYLGQGTVVANTSLVQGVTPVPASHLLAYNPIFNAESAGDYTLNVLSPALGLGSVASVGTTDLAGNARTTAFNSGYVTDAGAYEFSGSRTPAPVPLTLYTLPAPETVFYGSNATFTVTFPAGGASGGAWTSGGTTLTSNGHYTITNTATSSTLVISDVTAADAGSIQFTLGTSVVGTTYTSPAYLLTAEPQPIVYVSATAAPSDPVWKNAYLKLQDAVTAAPAGAQIWVAEGTYSWANVSAPRLRTGIQILGGFHVGDTLLTQRGELVSGTRTVDPTKTVATGEWLIDGVGGAVDSSATVDGLTLQPSPYETDLLSIYGGSSPTFTHCEITTPVVVQSGSPTFAGCIFPEASSATAFEAMGGTPLLDHCVFSAGATNNLFGSAILANGGTLTAAACSITGYDAQGASLIEVGSGGALVMDRATITGNQATELITMDLGSGAATVSNSLIANNQASGTGLVVAGGSQFTLVGCTVDGNIVQSGNAGIQANAGAVTVANSILWGNRTSMIGLGLSLENQQVIAAGGTLTVDANLIEGFATLGGTNNLATDPFFTNAAGGDFTLQSISPAINTADAAADPAWSTLDLAGNARVYGAAPDRGAYEYQHTPGIAFSLIGSSSIDTIAAGGSATFSVTVASGTASQVTWQYQAPGTSSWVTVPSNATYSVGISGDTTTSTLTVSAAGSALNGELFRANLPGGSSSQPFLLEVSQIGILYVKPAATGTGSGNSWANACTLPTALRQWQTGNQIWVANGSYAFSTQLSPPAGVQIYGGFAGTESGLSQRTGASASVFDLTGSEKAFNFASSAAGSVLDGLVMTNGTGAVDADAPITVTNCTFLNQATLPSIAIAVSGTIQGCTIAGNPNGAINDTGTGVTISQCTIERCGGVHSALVFGGTTASGTLVTQVKFLNNHGAVQDGATSNPSTPVVFDACTWTGNTALLPNGGSSGSLSAVFSNIAGANDEIRNSLIAGNNDVSGLGSVSNAGKVVLRGDTIAGNDAELYSTGTGNGSTVQSTGTLTIVNSILWNNTSSSAALGSTIEEKQLLSHSSGTFTITYTTIQGLTLYAGTGNSASDPLFAASGYGLTAVSPAVGSGDVTSVMGASDLLGNARTDHAKVDRGAIESEFAAAAQPVNVAIPVGLDLDSADGNIHVWNTLPGTLILNGDAATIAALQWQVLVNGVWTAVPSNAPLSQTVTVTDSATGTATTATVTESQVTSGTTTTLTVTLAGSEGPSATAATTNFGKIRYVVQNTPYASAAYAITTSPAQTIYIKPGGVAPLNGTSWTNAYADFPGTGGAVTAVPHTEIWVAGGTYAAALALPAGVRVLGGFLGTETSRDSRTTSVNATIGGAVTFNGGDGSARLDTVGVSTTLQHLVLTQSGGSFFNCTVAGPNAIAATGVGQTIDFENCTITKASSASATMIASTGPALIVNGCTFTGVGAAIDTTGPLTASNCRFSMTDPFGQHNVVSVEGGTDQATATPTTFPATGAVSLTGCTFAGNSTGLAPCFIDTTGAVTIVQCKFTNNSAAAGGPSALQIEEATVTLNDSYFAANHITSAAIASGRATGALELDNCQSVLVGDTFYNNDNQIANSGGGAGIGYNQVALPSHPGSDHSFDAAPVTASLALTNCLLWGNSANGTNLEFQQLGSSASTPANLTAPALVTCLLQGADTYAAPGIVPFDPQMVAQGSYSIPGPTSPALGAGTVTAGDPTDLLGNVRSFGSRSTPDLGAIEYQGAASTPVYTCLQTGAVQGAWVRITVDLSTAAAGIRSGLSWQINTGSGWSTLSSASIYTDTTSGTNRTVEIAWAALATGYQIRLAGSGWVSAPVTVNLSNVTSTSGQLLGMTPKTGTLVTSTKPAIALSVDVPAASNGISDATLVVHGSQHGRLLTAKGRWGTLSNAVPLAPTLTPGVTFNPGEWVDVSATTAMQTVAGGNYSNPLAARFQIPWSSRSGAFRQLAPPGSGAAWNGVATGDFDGDGNGDIVLAGASGVSMFLGDGYGGLTQATATDSNTYTAIAAADFNGDGKTEFVGLISGGGLVVKGLASNQASFSTLTSINGLKGTKILAGDFNNDGKQDILVLGNATTGEVLLLNNGDGTFTQSAQSFVTTAGDYTIDAVAMDLEGNGTLDFVQLCHSGHIYSWLNDGTGHFTSHLITTDTSAFGIALSDLYRDGYPDLLVAEYNSSFSASINVYRSDRQGGFAETTKNVTVPALVQFAVADFDGDGNPDIYTVSFGGQKDVLWTSDGSANFTEHDQAWETPGGSNRVPLAVLDLNGDGAPDILPLQGGVPAIYWTPGILFNGFGVGISQGSSATLSAQSILANTQSYSSDVLSGYTVAQLPAHGTLTQNSVAVTLGQVLPSASLTDLTYTPTASFSGIDYVRLAPTNGTTASPAGTIRITVNSTLVANGQTVSAVAAVAATITPTVTDPSGGTLTYTITQQPTYGTVALVGGTQFSYTASAGYIGTDSFSYTVTDQLGQSASATVTLQVASPTATVTSANGSGAGTLDAALAQINAATSSTWTITIPASLNSPTISIGAANDTVAGPSAYLIPAGVTVTLNGNGATLSPSAAGGNLRLFRVAAGATLNLNHLTIQGWTAQSSGTGATAYGGAIYCAGTANFTSVTFTGNTAQGLSGAAAKGGALYLAGTNTSVLATGKYDGNQATAAGGATGLGGAVYQAAGTVNYDGVIFGGTTANTATTAGGDVELQDGVSYWDQDAASTATSVSSLGTDSSTGLVIHVGNATLPSTIVPFISRPTGGTLTTVGTVSLAFPISDSAATLVTSKDSLTLTSGTQVPGITLANQGAATVLNVQPNGSIGTAVYDLVADDNASHVEYRQTVTISFNGDTRAPTVQNYATGVGAGQSVSVSLASLATAADGGPLTYSYSGTLAHGTLTGTAPNLIYTASAVSGSAVVTDTAQFTVTEDDGVQATGTLTFTVVPLSVTLTSASDWNNVMAAIAGAPSQTFTVTLSSALSSGALNAAATALPTGTAAGMASYVIAGHVIIDGSAYAAGAAINGNGQRLFYVGPGGHLELRSLTLASGLASGVGSVAGDGSAIYNNGGVLDLTAVAFHGNTAQNSGTVFSTNGVVNLTGCSFDANTTADGSDVSMAATNGDQQLKVRSEAGTIVVNGVMTGTGTLEVNSDDTTVMRSTSLPILGEPASFTVAGIATIPFSGTTGVGNFTSITATSLTPAIIPNSAIAVQGTLSLPGLYLTPYNGGSPGTAVIAVKGLEGGFTFERDESFQNNAAAAVTAQTVQFTPNGNGGTFTPAGTNFLGTVTYSVVTPGTYGTAVDNGDGTWTYSTTTFTFGLTDTIVMQGVDSNGTVGYGTITFTAEPDNAPAVSGYLNGATSFTVAKNVPFRNALFISDYDPAPLTYSVTTAPAHGTLQNDIGPPIDSTFGWEYNFVYTPDAGYVGSDSFVVTATDVFGQVTAQTITITVVDVSNDPAPIVTGVPTELEVAPGQTINPLAGVTVTAGNPALGLGFSAFSNTPEASVGSLSSGSGEQLRAGWFWLDYNDDTPANLTQALAGLTFTAASGATPSVYNFTFWITDDNGQTTTCTIPIQIVALGAAPTTTEIGTISTAWQTPVAVTLNGSQVDGDAITYQILTPPTHGTLSGSGASLTYTPNAGFSGSDSFTYAANAVTGSSAANTVNLTVAAPILPVAQAVTVSTPFATAVAVTLNGSQANGLALTYLIQTQPQHGTLSGSGASLTYTPNSTYSGTDTFTYEVSAATGVSGLATVTITVAAPVAPTAAATTPVTTRYLTPVTVTLLGAQANGEALTYHVSASPNGPQGGTASISGAVLTYAPNPGYSGTDTFTYYVTALAGTSATATVTVTVSAPVLPTAASPAPVTTPYNTPVTVTLLGAQANGEALTYHVSASPHNAQGGTTSITGAALTYTPNLGYSGTDTFTYFVTAIDGTSTTATVTVTVATPVIVTPAISIGAGSTGFAAVHLTGGTPGIAYSLSNTANLATPSSWSVLSFTPMVTTDATGAATYSVPVPADGSANYYRATGNTGTTDPIGDLAIKLRGSSDTIVSLPLLRPKLVETAIQTLAGPTFTVTGTVPSLPAEGAYALVMTGALEGAVMPVSSVINGNVTIVAGGYDLTQLKTETANGTGHGDLVAIVPYWTLDTVFPAGAGVAASTSTTTHATEILVYDDTQPGINLSPAATYYYFAGNSSQAAGWYRSGSTAAAGATRLVPLQYFTVRNNTTGDHDLVIYGAVQMAGYRVPVAILQGSVSQDNLLAVPVVTAMTLDGIGLHESGAVAPSANLFVPGDEVLLYDNTRTSLPKSAAATFYYFAGNVNQAAGWYQVGNLSATANSYALKPGEGLIIRKKSTGSPTLIQWSAVPSYLQ